MDRHEEEKGLVMGQTGNIKINLASIFNPTIFWYVFYEKRRIEGYYHCEREYIVMMLILWTAVCKWNEMDCNISE